MRDILVVMGSHPRTRDDFDWQRTDCDIVVFNEAMKQDWVKRADYVMQMHLPVIWQNPGNRNDPKHYEWLKSGNTPVILMQEQYPDVPRSQKFPLDEVLAIGGRYLTSSAAYSIAFGIVEGYKRIEIYGVEMETQTEYSHQRPGVSYWVGIARGKGIVVDFHGEMFNCPLYGYEGNIKFKYEFFGERLAELTDKTEKARETYNQSRDESNAKIEDYLKNGAIPEEVKKLVQNQSELGAMFGLQDGARQEILRYKNKADVQINATGDFLFSRQEFEHAQTTWIKKRDATLVSVTQAGEQTGRAFEFAKSTGNPRKRQVRMQTFITLAQKFIQESTKYGECDGAARENAYLMRKLDELVLMAGGSKSEEVLMREQGMIV